MMRKLLKQIKKRLRPFPHISQVGLECGTTALAIVCQYYGMPQLQLPLVDMVKMGDDGISLYDMVDIAQQLGFEAGGFQLTYDDWELLELPFIAHYGSNHFLVVYRYSSSHVWISDPAYGRRKVTKEQFAKKWEGVVLNMVLPEKHDRKYADELIANYQKAQQEVQEQYFYRPLREKRSKIVAGMLSLLPSELIWLAIPWLIYYFLNWLQFPYGWPIACFALAALLIQLGKQYGQQLLEQASLHFEQYLFDQLFQHLLAIRQSYFDSHSQEDLVSRFTQKINLRALFSPEALLLPIKLGLIPIYLILLFYWLPTSLFAASILASLCYGLGLVWLENKYRLLSSQIYIDRMRSLSMILDSLKGLESIKILGVGKQVGQKWNQQHEENLIATKQSAGLLRRMELAAAFIGWLGTALFLGAALYSLAQEHISLSEALIGAYLLWQLKLRIELLTQWGDLKHFFHYTLHQIQDILHQPKEFDVEQAGQDEEIIWKEPRIELNGLCFKYNDNQEQNSLHNISGSIAFGSKIGIVGRNGSGKSSLAKLLIGLYPSYTGTMLINGQSLKEIPVEVLRQHIFLFSQHVHLFNLSLRENITYGIENVSEEQLWEAAEKADLKGFIDGLYYGLDQRIGQMGTSISGGEQLKIGFARLFLRQPKIIILDEASSALDIEAEALIMKQVYANYADVTIIAIAHRMKTLEAVDEIWVMESGEVVEKGQHQDLLTQEGAYFEMMTHYL